MINGVTECVNGFKEHINMEFYNPKGEEIASKEEFIKLYSNIYYVLVGNKNANIESDIEFIYCKGIKANEKDFIRFLKWKVGDKNKSSAIITTDRGRRIDVDRIKQLARELKYSELKFEGTLSIEDVKKIYNFIVDPGIANVGSVYTLALISMITKGQFPIYDRFADVGLEAVSKGYKIRSEIEYKEMPDKTSANSVMKRYKEYMDRLNDKFGDRWKESRDVDRALWTYGHMFFIK